MKTSLTEYGQDSVLSLHKIISRAYQSLRLIFDPAMEGNPYELERDYKSYKANRTNKSSWTCLTKRYVIQGA
jgi:hypothetical protein